ncbi:RINT1-like protein MAG2 [Morus notabilis]|uniref:RINT1-like protein MAG2 n=1 Tax=Morus notabilis TaxID=981085 RepID=UPI000CED3B6E|nr:RINT1-like protein MAG2 [Morus notabilis]
MDSSVAGTLPPAMSLSASVLFFLNHNLNTGEALSQAPSLVSELQAQCGDLDQNLIDLNRNLGEILVAYSSFSDQIHALFADINAQLIGLLSSTSSPSSASADGEGGEGKGRTEQILGEELPALAKEVARVEAVRIYAETALKLDSLIGDIEDAVSSTMTKNLKKYYSTQNSEDTRLHAIRTLKQTEDILTSITKTHPQWGRLMSAVDHRVDRALAILRPQAIADHRALLVSLGWPPPLSSTSSAVSNSTKFVNPLFTMQGDLKDLYCENFFALCNLQELQRRRKSRQLEGYSREVALHQPLWVIEELVNPISLASQRHFSKWVEKPEFIFALVYKITRDYVDSMDELLQPLVDEAMLSGYSCREEWISAMVSSLSTYLAKEIFPKYVAQLEEENNMDTQSQARISWLNLIDLMISFDKQIKSLLEHSGIFLSFEDDGNLQKISSLSVFCDRPDWLEVWAEIELRDILDKLKTECNVEKNWTMKVKGAILSSNPEDYKAPAISSAFLRRLSSVIDRCRSLPTLSLRSKFLRSAGAPIIQNFLECLLLRCQEAEGLTALTDDDALIKVANSINAARNFESVLMEWCEDVFFLELGSVQGDQSEVSISANKGGGLIEDIESSVLDKEIGKLEGFRIEWVEKLSVVTLRGFDALCRDYIKNKRQWQEKSEEGWTVSKSLVGALDYLQGKMSVLEVNLNGKDFIGVWRSLAAGIDRLVFNGILLSNVKFRDGGIERFANDLEVLFGVFRAWCLRPEGFFPKSSEGLKLLKMSEKQLKDVSAGTEKWMKENGFRHLSVVEVDRIVKSIVF